MKVYCLALCALLASTAALAESGKLRVCRMPGIVGLTDGKVVELPAGTYTGSCPFPAMVRITPSVVITRMRFWSAR